MLQLFLNATLVFFLLIIIALVILIRILLNFVPTYPPKKRRSKK